VIRRGPGRWVPHSPTAGFIRRAGVGRDVRVENSFIPVRGVGEHTERRLWRDGITRWDEFDRTAVGPKTGRRIESFIDEARDRLDRGDAEYFDSRFPAGERWRLYENFRESVCFFDIETTGLDKRRDAVTTVSVHLDGETRTFVRGDDLAGDRLAAAFGDAELLATFNGARFDVPFVEAAFDIEVTTPHLDLMYPCRQLGHDGGLKRVERDLGIDRELPDVDGREAVRLWRRYEAGDDDALERLIAYNREDAVNLRQLADRVTERLDERVFRSVAGQ